jgi:predicted nucleotidyltransferase
MGQLDKKWDKILEVYYEHPRKSFTIRELARLTNIPKSTAQRYLAELTKKGLVSKENKTGDSLLFKFKKINFHIEKIAESGLIEELVEKLNPSCIILFGSIRKGDSVKESDIDLFIESPVEKEIDLRKYEKKLKHNIQLFIEKDINKLQPHLFNNLINGIKLYGSFAVK